MPSIIEIRDRDERGFLDVDLNQVLSHLRKEGPSLSWSILYLYAVGDLGEGFGMLDLEEKIQASPEGVTLQWETIFDLSHKFRDIYDLILVGYHDPHIPKLGPEDSRSNLYENCEIVVERDDSSLWRIFARDNDVVDRLRNSFPDAELREMEGD
jgi:hypothetical protein